MPSGTHTIADLQAITDQSAANFGLTEIAQILQADLAAFNAVLDTMMADLATMTTERQENYGASDASDDMQRADEFDRGVAVKAGAAATVGYPLYKYQRGVGWTHDYMLQNTPAQIANTVLTIQQRYRRAAIRELQLALFTPTNATVRDAFVTPNIDLGVKRLVNADSQPIPNGPNSEVFDASTHTHYDWLNGASPTEAALLAAADDVIEHGHGGQVLININRAAETAVRALTGFVPYYAGNINPTSTAMTADGTLDITRQTNRAIGVLNGSEVWVRSWVPAGYAFTFDVADPMKPLAYRQHPVAAARGLRIVAQNADYPLYSEMLAGYFGFGVKTRTNGHVLYYAGGAAAYVAPSL